MHLAQPAFYHGGVHVVVIHPAFVASIVRRVYVDALHLPSEGGQQGLERQQVVAPHDEVVVQRVALGDAEVGPGLQLVVFHRQVMVLYEGLAFEVQRGHLESWLVSNYLMSGTESYT